MSRSGALNLREAWAQSNTRRISRRTLFMSWHDPRPGRGSAMKKEKRNRPAIIVRRCLRLSRARNAYSAGLTAPSGQAASTRRRPMTNTNNAEPAQAAITPVIGVDE
jgi:hypothetical protein